MVTSKVGKRHALSGFEALQELFIARSAFPHCLSLSHALPIMKKPSIINHVSFSKRFSKKNEKKILVTVLEAIKFIKCKIFSYLNSPLHTLCYSTKCQLYMFRERLILMHCQCKPFYTVNQSETTICMNFKVDMIKVNFFY
jgi:hypothetical protein